MFNDPPGLGKLAKLLAKSLGPAADRVVLDPEEFAGGPQCVQCRLCWIYRAATF